VCVRGAGWRAAECDVTLRAGILYTSRETHYSVMKAARMYRMDAVEVRLSHDPGPGRICLAMRSAAAVGYGFFARRTLSHQQCCGRDAANEGQLMSDAAVVVAS